MAINTANFKIDYHACLDNFHQNHINIDINKLKQMYEKMLFVRLFDAKAIVLQRTGQLGTFPSCLGQEAIGTGIGFALKPHIDVFITYYRDYAVQLMRGVTMTEILAYWGGSEMGNHYQAPSAKEDLPVCIPIGSQCLHAAGIASAFKIRQQKRAALVTCGDGATSQGDFYETVNVAGAWHLPLVIVINNNQWAISVPRDKQSKAQTLAQKGIAGGIDCEQVDGNDVLAVYERVSIALDKARAGNGPTLIEALSYRLSDHTTADDAARYRQVAELEQAKRNDPLIKLKKFLISCNAWTEAELDLHEKFLIKEYTQQIETAVKAYLDLPLEPVENMFKFHYDADQ